MGFTEAFPFCFYVPDAYQRPYTLEVRTGQSELLRKLVRFWDAEMTLGLNQPSLLQFSVRAEDEAFDILTGSNEIWVRNEDDDLVERYRLSSRDEHSDDRGAWLRITAHDALGDLAAEMLDEYDVTDTIANHLSSWFGALVGPWAPSLGTVDNAISSLSRDYDTSGQVSVLAAIIDLDKTITDDTIFYIDEDGAFQWQLLSSVAERGFQLRPKRNVSSLTRRIDYTRQVTRIYARGRNDGGRYVRLSDAAGQSENYVQSDLVLYKFRRQIVLDHLTVDPPDKTDHSFNYVLSSDAHLAANAESDGSDIQFLSTANGTSTLTRTINSYTAATGALDVDVTIPSVSCTADTVIYMVYGL